MGKIKLLLADIVFKLCGRERYKGKVTQYAKYDIITKEYSRHNECYQLQNFGAMKSSYSGNVIRWPRWVRLSPGRHR